MHHICNFVRFCSNNDKLQDNKKHRKHKNNNKNIKKMFFFKFHKNIKKRFFTSMLYCKFIVEYGSETI